MHTSIGATCAVQKSGGSSASRKTVRLFVVVALIHIAVALLYQHTVLTERTYRAVLAEHVDPIAMDEALATVHTMSLLGTFILPFLLCVRVAAVALLLQFGFLLFWEEIPFSRLFRVLTVASLAGAAMLCTRTVMVAASSAEDVAASSLMLPPLSLADLVGIGTYTPAARVVLQNAGVFELIWLFLVWRGVSNVVPLARSDVAFVVLVVWCSIVLLQVAVVMLLGGGIV